MAEFQRKPSKFILGGTQLSRPVDLIDATKQAIARNVRSFTDGVIEPRPGLLVINASAVASGAIHSIKRLNDEIAPTLPTPLQAYGRFIGAGTKLYSDNSAHDTFTEIDSGYSGDPLSFIAHRPEQSPQPWLYIGDSLRLRKSKVDGTDYQWGITPPNTAPSIAVASPNFKTIDDCEAATFGGWAGGGAAAGALTNPDRIAAVAISQILYDSGTTGWALVNPASMADITEGMYLTTSASAETVLVKQIFKAVTTSTIASIQYDSGTSGLCTIQLTTPTAEIVVNSMLRNTTRTENIRVLSVTYGLDGIPSFRCSTSATFVAGDTFNGLACFRAYFANNHAAAETISTKMLNFVISGSGITYITRTAALDLSQANNRPISPDDEVVINIQVDDPSKITEIQIQLDVDGTTNDFTKNYYWKDVRASDLTPAVQQTSSTLSATQRVIQREDIDRYRESLPNTNTSSFNYETYRENRLDNPLLQEGLDTGVGLDPNQTALGASQWSIIRIKVKDFIRAGSDETRGWKDVQAIRVSVNATGALVLKVDAWHIEGTYGAKGDFYYRYRYRNKETGEPSAWSPANRSPVTANRDRLTLAPTTSGDAQVDLIDWIRRGDVLNEWHYVGTQANSSTFTDDYPDDVIEALPIVLDIGTGADTQVELAGLDSVQPFPVIDVPHSGVCNVKGTEVTQVSGDTFNTTWIPGTQIIINNIPYTLYASPTSTTKLSLNENAGNQSNVNFFLADPIKQGQPLDAYFGAFGEGISGVTFFGVKGGVLYWTNGNNPGLVHRSNQLQVTGGSEVLMNGVIYDGRPYVASNLRWYEIQIDSQGNVVAIPLAHTKGLVSRWAFCQARDTIYYLSEDGVYAWPGETQKGQLITDDLGALFPHEGQVGSTINGIVPPDFSQTSRLRMAHYDGFLYFDFLDTGSSQRTAVLDLRSKAWSVDTYTPTIYTHYGEEGKGVHSLLLGGSNGKLYQSSGTSDAGSNIACQVRTRSDDCGDSRAQKLFSDCMLDIDQAGVQVTIQPGFDNYATLPTATVLTVASGRKQSIIDFNSGEGTLARNIALDITWSGQSTVKLYEWQPSYLVQPETTIARATDWDDGGTLSAKRYQGVTIEADTFNVSRTVEVHYINESGVETVGATLSIQHNGQSVKDYSFDTPFYAYKVRLVPTDSNSWKLFTPRFWFQPSPELGTVWDTPQATFGLKGYFHIYEMEIAHISTSDITMTIYVDGVALIPVTIANGSGVYKKTRVRIPAKKGRQVRFVFTSSAKFRLFHQDSECKVKEWGSAESYQSVQPFGGLSYSSGAEI